MEAPVDTIQDALNDIDKLGELTRTIDNVELHAAVVELKSKLVDIKLETSKLHERIAELERVDEIEAALRFEHDAYWQQDEGETTGPLCSRCWDVDRKLVRQRNARIANQGRHRWICPACENGCWIPIADAASD
jgi:hypothetical protein